MTGGGDVLPLVLVFVFGAALSTVIAIRLFAPDASVRIVGAVAGIFTALGIALAVLLSRSRGGDGEKPVDAPDELEAKRTRYQTEDRFDEFAKTENDDLEPPPPRRDLDGELDWFRSKSDDLLEGSASVTIPEADWILCLRYRETLETRTQDLRTCARDGKAVREARDNCVGELAGATERARDCSRERDDLRLSLELLRADTEARKPAMFWASVGAFLLSAGALSLELFAGTAPEPVKAIAFGGAALVSGGLVVWTF